MSRALVFIAAASAVALGFWLGGFDFSERGFGALMCYMLSLWVGIMVAGYPGDFPWEKK